MHTFEIRIESPTFEPSQRQGGLVSELAVQGLFAVLGVPVTHVPWFRDLVDRIIMGLPFTMLGTPSGTPMGRM